MIYEHISIHEPPAKHQDQTEVKAVRARDRRREKSREPAEQVAESSSVVRGRQGLRQRRRVGWRGRLQAESGRRRHLDGVQCRRGGGESVRVHRLVSSRRSGSQLALAARLARLSALSSRASAVRDVREQLAPLVAHLVALACKFSDGPTPECCLRLDAVAKDIAVERQCVGVRVEGVPTYKFHHPSIFLAHGVRGSQKSATRPSKKSA